MSFTTSLPQEFSFNLECRVRHKPTPLRLNVKARGYEVKMGLSFTNTSGDTVDIPVHSQATREIKFGKVLVPNFADFPLYDNWSRCPFVSEHWARSSLQTMETPTLSTSGSPRRSVQRQELKAVSWSASKELKGWCRHTTGPAANWCLPLPRKQHSKTAPSH